MQIGLLAVRTQSFDSVRLTTEINPGEKSKSDINPPVIQVQHGNPEGNTSMTDHGEDDTTERLLEPSDGPISEGTIRAVVVVGLITLFVASFLYWQSWKERNNKTPCTSNLRIGFNDVVNAQFRRVRANANRHGAAGTGDQRGQRSQISRTKPGRVEPPVLDPTPAPPSCLSTTSLPNRPSAIYHSSTRSQMIFICETVRPTTDNVGVTPTVGQSPKGNSSSKLAMSREQLVLHV